MLGSAKTSTASTPLFRPEVSPLGQTRTLGAVLIHQPLGYSMSALLAFSLVLLITAFAYFGSYTRKTTVIGLLMPEQGMFRLASSGEGYITKVKVREGQSVEAGDVLFVLSGERISTTGSIHNFISEQLDQRQLLLERNRALVNERSHDQLSILNVRARTIDEEQARLSEEVYLLEWRIDLLRTNLSVSNNW